MRLVVGALFVEQLRLCLPVKPSIVERTVRVTNETGLIGAAPPEQGVPYPAGVEPPCSLHDDRVPLRNLFVAQIRVEVIGDTLLEPVAVDIDEESVTRWS